MKNDIFKFEEDICSINLKPIEGSIVILYFNLYLIEFY